MGKKSWHLNRRDLLKGTGVAVLPGDGFGPSAEGHVRISLTTPDEALERACERMVDYLSKTYAE